MNAKGIGLTIGGVLAVLLMLVGVAFAVPVFKLETIDVQGAKMVSPEQVQEATGLQEGENLLRIDARAAAEGVAQLPWVHVVSVKRSLPSSVNVTIEERVAVAYIDQPDGPHLIDAFGREFIIEIPPEGAVRLVGGESGSDNWKHAIEIAAALPVELRQQAAEIEAHDAFNYVIIMKDGRRVVWGASEDNADKARALATVMKMESDAREWNISNPELVSSL